MNRKNFTQEDLAKVGRMYDENADKLMASDPSTGVWLVYLKRERKLHNLDIAIRKHLGIHITLRRNGGVVVGNSICATCGGKFAIVRRKGRGDILYCSKWCEWTAEQKALKKKAPRPWAQPPSEWVPKKEASVENANIV
ncbi:MAG: hypothetical protein WC208_10380 [Gallionella sp.]|jgi:hypothetical protein